MKKFLIGILTAMLLVGCGSTNLPEPGNETQDSTVPFTSDLSFTPGELTYYINLPQTEHWTLSTYMTGKVEAIVLSSEKLDSIMNYPLECSNFASRVNITLEPFYDEEALEYPLYLYQTYRGIDWQQMAQLKKEAEIGSADALSKLQEYERMFADDFTELTADDIPQFYTYSLALQTGFSESRKADRYHGMELNFGNDTVTVPLGTLDLTNLPLWDGMPEAEELPQKALDAVRVSYWTDTAELPAVQIKGTSEPQVLTGIAYFGGDVELSDICLTWEENSETVTHQWDGATPITIPAFTDATLSATLHHAGKSVMGYCAGGYLAISLESEGKNQRLWYSLPLTQYWNAYELYAVAVDGIDLEPYYSYAYGYTSAEPKREKTELAQTFGQLLWEQDGFSVTAIGAYVDNFAYTMTLALENETEETTEFFFENLYVNGYRYPKYPSSKVSAGTQEKLEITFPWEELNACGITAKSVELISLLEMELTIRNSDDQWLVDSQSLLPLYPQGQDEDPQITVTPNMMKLVDTERYELWVLGDRIPKGSLFDRAVIEAGQYRSQMLFINKSNQSLSFGITAATVNGESVATGYRCFVSAGRFAIDEYIVFYLEDHRWVTAEEITVFFEIKAADGSWIETTTGTYYPHVPLS